jgi:predicted metal-dependent peptidase
MVGFPTNDTDGRRLVYNPAFVEKLTAAELEGVLAHEVMHCALALSSAKTSYTQATRCSRQYS